MTQSPYRIPFNRPAIVNNEMSYVADAVRMGHWAGDGPFTRKCESLLQNALGAPCAMLTTSCTSALEMAALLLKPNHDSWSVIVPSFTFPSTANAFARAGARLVFVDIRLDTLNLDEGILVSDPRLCDRDVIVPVHYAGVACDMQAIAELAGAKGVDVVEDNAHGLMGGHFGQALGTFGCMSALSFHETKNFTCGEGGALIINKPIEDSRIPCLNLIRRAEILREKGTDRSQFHRGEVDKYTWVDTGSSYLPSDIQAAFLLGQLEQRDWIMAKRRQIWHNYDDFLSGWAIEHGVRQPFVPAKCQQAYHMYWMVMPDPRSRDGLIEYLKGKGILAVSHYQPLHLSPMGMHYGGRKGQCPVAESVAECIVRLPFFTGLKQEEQNEVVDAVKGFDKWAK